MSVTTAAVKIGDSVQSGLDSFFAFLPNLLGFLVILIVGYVIAKIVKAVVSKVFEKVGLDKALHSGQLGEQVEKVSPGAKPSKLIGSVAFWLIFVFVLTAAIGALKIPAVTSFMNDVLAYLPNVIAAVVIFVLAGAIAGGVAALVAKTMGDTPTGKLVGAVVPILVMGIATFMILDQLGIAPQIVTITYAALMGSAALGLALAFGLGGRQLAGDILRDAYDKGDRKKDDAKRDLEKGKERGKDQAQSVQQTANSGSTQSNPSAA
jgi:small-conductance mechanosensitive channel